MTTTAKASSLSFEPLGICSSFQATKLSSRSLTKHTCLIMRWSCVSYSPFTYPTTSLESHRTMIFFEDTDVTRLIPARITSYLVSLLDMGKSNHMACSILSPVGALSCKPTLALVFRDAPSTLRIHQPALFVSTSRLGISAKKSASKCPFNAKRGLY